MSTGRRYDVNINNHLDKNPHVTTFAKFKSAMASLDARLVREEQERKARKEGKK